LARRDYQTIHPQRWGLFPNQKLQTCSALILKYLNL
jgi:hypothetical protein